LKTLSFWAITQQELVIFTDVLELTISPI